jgi:patatin-like phospholipase/acyl hydrolase
MYDNFLFIAVYFSKKTTLKDIISPIAVCINMIESEKNSHIFPSPLPTLPVYIASNFIPYK